MKNLLVILFLSLSLFSSVELTAQSIQIIQTSDITPRQDTATLNFCYDPQYLAAISNEMFKQGNPRYIWVDLVKDGYILLNEKKWYNLYIGIESKESGGNIDIPNDIRDKYAEKWLQFVAYIKEPNCKYGWYRLSTDGSITSEDIDNPNSTFRKTDKVELHQLSLTSRGELRLLNELVKDGLAPLDKAMNLEFSNKGFYVHEKRLSRELREKYMNICKEEFGHNYYNDQSSWKRGALPENILSKDIAELTARINAVENNSDNK